MMIQAWISSDGKLFKTEEEYLRYQEAVDRSSDFKDFYDDLAIYGKVEIQDEEDLERMISKHIGLFESMLKKVKDGM